MPPSKKNLRFELRFYEGSRGKERPRSLVVGERQFEIDEILDQKRVLDTKTGKTTEVFTCRMGGQKIRLTVHEDGTFEVFYL
ncbi:MAG: hypothetical protein ACE5LV_05060 [Candidatus Aminicenantales bacterium]